MNVRGILLKEKTLPVSDVLSIVSAVCSSTRERVLASIDDQLNEPHLEEIEKCIEERKEGKPLAYITHIKEFYSQDFFVDGNVLIPRPETEMLVEEALRIIQEHEDITKVLDMGTGSGVIGLTVSGRTSKKVLCVDVSQKALDTARMNAAKTNARVDFLCSNLFDGIKAGTRFDMVLTNLPYVSDSEWDGLMKDVKDFEPRLALSGGDDGMEIYREFAQCVGSYINPNGHVLCEIGGYHQAHTLKYLLENSGFDTLIKNDYAGIERIVIAQWTNS
ncbi:MAG TPA: peptide chain release factor N(5)-glutamine methyltransferase [Syntrophorhabdaceae bacterium]|nr:peptide chain release factor N(5)-glutamine methyltransferase [Syntrophorhabdaceae bacterium]